MSNVEFRLNAWTLTQLNKEMKDLINSSPEDTLLIKDIYYSKILQHARVFMENRILTPMEFVILKIAESWFKVGIKFEVIENDIIYCS